MLKRILSALQRRRPPDAEPASPAPVEQRDEARVPVFRQAELTLEGYYRIQAVITELSASGARIEYATRIDLPARLVIAEPTLRLKRWARVAWQHEGAAGLEFQEDA
jgi:hypothetical protein